MHFTKTAAVSLAALAAPAAATYQCPLAAPPGQPVALQFAYSIQNLLLSFYNEYDFGDASSFSDVPNATMVESNGMTKAENIATNFRGLQTQAKIGVTALQIQGQRSPGFQMNDCDYNFPFDSPTGSQMLMTSQSIEATLCGAFIGLADYVQMPDAAFLMARMAAEHGIHASYIRTNFQSVGFMENSSSLTPAFTPDHVASQPPMMEMPPTVGYLGQFLGSGCAMTPPAPCDVNVHVGPLVAGLSGGVGSMNGTGMNSPTATAAGAMGPAGTGMSYGSGANGGYGYGSTPTPGAMYTGAATANKPALALGAGAIGLAALL